MPERSSKAPELANSEPETHEIRLGRRATDDVVAYDERRSAQRYAFTATAEVVDMKSRTRMQTRISDLSLEGCYVDTNAPFPINTDVRIRITTAKSVFKCLGTVVYSLPNMGMGISFGEQEPAQREVLSKWIDELSGAVPADFDAPESDVPESSLRDAQLYVLQELVYAMMRAKTITESDGKALLHRLGR